MHASALPHALAVSTARRPWSFRFALVLCALTVVLLAAGALVTSTGSSLAVPDWPLAYGELFPPMVGGILYEHGHRLIAAAVGLLTVLLAVWLWRVERRRWVVALGFAAVGLVIAQGLLGGITVLLLLPKAVSIGHAILAQTFFLTAVALAQVTAPGWEGLLAARPRAAGGTAGNAAWRSVRAVAALLLAAVFAQLALGAAVRHYGAGLAIPDFPLAYGRLIPPLGSFQVLIHFLHRVAALLALLLAGLLLWRALRRHPGEPRVLRPAALTLALVMLQIGLGGFVIWSQRTVESTVLHVVNGALLLAAVGVLTLRAWLLESAPGPARLGATGGSR